MPFPTALSSGQLDDLRASGSSYAQYLAVCPNTVVFQAQVNGAIVDRVFAQFAYDNVTTGSISDVKLGQTVIIHGAIDSYTFPLARTYVRELPDDTTFYVGEQGIALQDNYYVTVLDDYDVHLRLRRGDLADWNRSYYAIPPVIGNLQATYVNTVASGSASFSFAPTVQAMAYGASIVSYAWDVDDGTITTGTSSTKDITVSFPQGHRWCVLTVTDSNGNANYIAFEVYVGLADIIELGFADGASITADLLEGYNATIPATSQLSSILDSTRATLFTVDTDSVFGNVDCVGRVRQMNSNSQGDELFGVTSGYELTLEGFSSQLARLSTSAMTVVHAASPTRFEEVTRPTPSRAIAHMLTIYSTFTNVVPLLFFDDSAFIADTIEVQEGSMRESIAQIAGRVNAGLNWSSDGQCSMNRHAAWLDSERASLPVVASLTTADVYKWTVTRRFDADLAYVISQGVVYNTTSGASTYYGGKAPATVRSEGEEPSALNAQILTANASESDAVTELGQRTGHELAYRQKTETIEVTLRSGWHNCAPTNYARFTVEFAGYTTGTYWQLESVQHQANIETGTREVTATLRRETLGGGAQRVVSIIPPAVEEDLPYIPVPPNDGAFPTDPDLIYDDNPTSADLQPIDDDFSQPVPPGNTEPVPTANCWTGNISFKSSTNIATPFLTTLGENYTITVTGDAVVQGQYWEKTFDFTASDGGWVVATEEAKTGTPGTYVTSTGWQHADYREPDDDYVRGVAIKLEFDERVITYFKVVYDYTLVPGAFSANTPVNALQLSPSNFNALVMLDDAVSGTDLEATWEGSFSSSYIQSRIRSSNSGKSVNTQSGAVLIKSITLRGLGVSPFSGSTGFGTDIRGDAFYYNYQSGGAATLYPSTLGLRVDNAQVTPKPLFNPNHQYSWDFTGTGNQVLLRFQDSDYTDNSNNVMTVKICGPNASQS